MIIDKKGKLFGKINLLDILIILAILAFVALGATKIFSNTISNKKDDKTIELTYTLEVTKKDADFFESINEGDIVFKKNTHIPGGEILSCDVKPAKYVTPNTDTMTYDLIEVEDKFDGHIKIKVEADMEYPDLIVDGEIIKIGKEQAVRSENTIMNGYVIAMEYDKEIMKDLSNEDEEMIGGLSNDN